MSLRAWGLEDMDVAREKLDQSNLLGDRARPSDLGGLGWFRGLEVEALEFRGLEVEG